MPLKIFMKINFLRILTEKGEFYVSIKLKSGIGLIYREIPFNELSSLKLNTFLSREFVKNK